MASTTQTLPLLKDNKDPFYRYTMPKLRVRYEGERTMLENLESVSKKIERPAVYIAKYFGYALGTKIQEKTTSGVCNYAINGMHDVNRLISLLYVFIDKFVLCSHCNNPETVLKLNSKDIIYAKCRSCGEKTTIEDSTHKVTSFIKTQLAKDKKITKKSEKKTATSTKSTSKKVENENNNNNDNDDDDEEWSDYVKPVEDQKRLDAINAQLDKCVKQIDDGQKVIPVSNNELHKVNNNENGNLDKNNNNDDEDDEKSGDFIIEYSHRVNGVKIEEIKETKPTVNTNDDNGDDINIDEI